MKFITRLTVILAFGIFSSILFNVSFAKAETSPSTENEVKIGEIKSVVSNFTYDDDLIPDIEKNDLNSYKEVYDFDGNLMGYVFEFNKNNQDYFVFASNNYELMPIISFGEGKFISDEYLTGDSQEIFYDGGFRVTNEEGYLELNSYNEEEANNVTALGISRNKKSKYNFLRYDSSNKNEWDKLKNLKKIKAAKNKSLASAIPSSHVLPVTRYWQRTAGITSPETACGPTTGAMFSQYLKNIMGYNVRGLSDYSSLGQYVNHMGKDMFRSTVYGTIPRDFAFGLQEHLDERYAANNSFPWSTEIKNAYGNFDLYKKEIGYFKFPVALFFGYNTKAPDPVAFSWHYVLGVGYKYSASGTASFGVKDPDSGKDNYDTKWYVWNKNNDYMSMIIANYSNN